MWATPNCRRISILFEELGLNFKVEPVNIRAEEQFDSEVVALNPFGKVPIVTWQGDEGEQSVLFESGAILSHFADKHGAFFPAEGSERQETLSWLMVILTALGPHSAYAHYWSTLAKDKVPKAIDYHVKVVSRVYGLLEKRLNDNQYLAGQYSIADIAAYPWIDLSEWTTLNMKNYPNLKEWYKKISNRPAVKRGMNLPKGIRLE